MWRLAARWVAGLLIGGAVVWGGGASAAGAETVFAPTPYRDGVIYPDTPAAMDAALVAFYADWKALYLHEGCGKGRAYVAVDADQKWDVGDGVDNVLTVSEAQGYGMLALVLLADADPDAHRLFDAMLRYFHDHPSHASPAMMAWRQMQDCSNFQDTWDDGSRHEDAATATDGDMDVGYALLLAEARWGNSGAFDYGAEARATIAAIMANVVDKTNFLHIGATEDWPEPIAHATRTSDFMMSHMQAFAAASGDVRWGQVRQLAYKTLAAISNDKTGLMPDFALNMPDHPVPAFPEFMEGGGDGMYSWNAARTPWRVALDDLLYDSTEARAVLTPLNAFFRSATKGDPAQVMARYALDGSGDDIDGEGELVFTSMLAVSAMTAPENRDWLAALWQHMLHIPLRDGDYFGNTLKLMAMISVSGHWAKP